MYHSRKLYRLFVFSSGTNNKGDCNMIRTRPSFFKTSLSFGYLPQPSHINETSCQGHSQKNVERTSFPFKMADNR